MNRHALPQSWAGSAAGDEAENPPGPLSVDPGAYILKAEIEDQATDRVRLARYE